MTLEEKDKYIAEHLMKLTDETLRFMVADLTAEVGRLQHSLSCILCDEHQSAPVLESKTPEEEPCLICLCKGRIAASKELRSVIREADEYLDTNDKTNIAHGSILHRKFKDALAESV